jgi:hypothetical protein
MPSIKKKFDTYAKFSDADFSAMFSNRELEDVYKLKATNFASTYIENKGGGRFDLHPLPLQAQFSAVQSIAAGDYDGDGHLDALIAGNFYSPDFMTGRYDASIGLLLKGNGKGGFTPLPASQSGIHITGDARSLQTIHLGKKPVVAVGVNKGKMIFYWVRK